MIVTTTATRENNVIVKMQLALFHWRCFSESIDISDLSQEQADMYLIARRKMEEAQEAALDFAVL
ncbi:MAG: hypothetical protein AAF607_06345 [Pseudomonadota bacterium]